MTISIILGMTASRAVFLGFILLFCVYLILVKKKFFTLILIWFFTSLIFFTISQAKESENPRINELAGSIEALSLYLRGDVDIGGSLEWRRELAKNGIEALKKSYGFVMCRDRSNITVLQKHNLCFLHHVATMIFNIAAGTMTLMTINTITV